MPVYAPIDKLTGGIWRNSAFRRLYAAHATSLLGSGLSAIALGLLAHQLVGASASMVLGVALTIRIAVIVLLSPWAGIVAGKFGSKTAMILCDILRAVVVLGFLLVSHVWQIYALAVLLNAGSALFTPIYKALIPGVVTIKEYPRALAWGTAAYDASNILAPALAGLIIATLGFRGNFVLNAAAFLLSATLLFGLPRTVGRAAVAELATPQPSRAHGIRAMLTRWPLRISLLLALQASVAGALVLVGTVGLVKSELRLNDNAYAWVMAMYGAGSVTGAFIYAKIERTRQTLFRVAALQMTAALCWVSLVTAYWAVFPAWALLGAAQAVLGIRSNELLAGNTQPSERASIYSAHFALSHLGWGFSYPMAGLLVSHMGFAQAALVFAAALAVISAPLWIYSVWMWFIHRGLPDAAHDHIHPGEDVSRAHRHGKIQHRHFHLHF